MSDDFMEEVKEDVRNDQLLAIWHAYGNIIIGAIIAIILATIGYLFWHNHQEKKILEQTLAYEKNITLDTSKGEKPDYSSLIQDGSMGYKIMGTLEQARSAATSKEAQDLLKAMADNSSFDGFYRQLAELQMIMKKFDSTNGKELLSDLEDLVAKESPVQAAALELQGFAHLKLSNVKAALQSFSSVAQHPQAPQSMRTRAYAMVETLRSAK